MNQEQMKLSDIEMLGQTTDLQLRTYIKEQIDMKHFINGELKKINIDIDYEMKLIDALKIIENNIQRIRVEGLS